VYIYAYIKIHVFICMHMHLYMRLYRYMYIYIDDQIWLRFRSPNNMSREDAVMLGLYSMNEDQNESYIKFVHLLAGWNIYIYIYIYTYKFIHVYIHI
jgi:hypothetical protein